MILVRTLHGDLLEYPSATSLLHIVADVGQRYTIDPEIIQLLEVGDTQENQEENQEENQDHEETSMEDTKEYLLFIEDNRCTVIQFPPAPPSILRAHCWQLNRFGQPSLPHFVFFQETETTFRYTLSNQVMRFSQALPSLRACLEHYQRLTKVPLPTLPLFLEQVDLRFYRDKMLHRDIRFGMDDMDHMKKILRYYRERHGMR